MPPQVERISQNPIIRPAMLPAGDGDNINGPCLIRVPHWVQNPLGKYYLYFAHHSGQYIRLAYADRLQGPWTIHAPGVLHVSDAPACHGHIASPDVIIDHANRQLRLYFHGPAKGHKTQQTFLATSADGLRFHADDKPLGLFYWRVWQYDNAWYAMAKGGLLYRSPDGIGNWQPGHSPFTPYDPADPHYNRPGSVRHVAVDLQGDTLWIYFTRIGDAPETIRRAPMTLQGDWHTWRAGESQVVLAPQEPYEGADLPVTPSRSGASRTREHAVRDPHVFVEDGQRYLVYSVAGESGLAIARLR